MKNVLFIVNTGIISSNENGGASVYFSHLELLFKAGFQIELLAVEWSKSTPYKESDYEEVKHMVKKIIPFKSHLKAPRKGLNRIVDALFYPEKFEYYFLNKKNRSFLNRLVSENSIDIVWSYLTAASISPSFKLPFSS